MKPPMASSASRRNAMLQPGTCSAMRSSSSTCVGPPGARAMHCAIGGSSAGTTFGPPEPTTSEVRNGWTRNVSQSRSTRVSASVYATISPVASARPTLRAALRPPFGMSMTRTRGCASRDLARAIARAVVDEDDFEVGIGQPLERGEAVLERVGRVVGADDDRDARPGRPARRRGTARRRTRARRLPPPASDVRSRSTRPNAQSSTSIAAAPPFVGPGERDRAARAFVERRADVHRRDGGLPVFAFANAVGAGLGQQQRLVAGDVLQPREIRAQLRLAVQVDVERADVEEREIEKFGRRKVDVREQRVRRDGLGRLGRGRAGSARRAGVPCQRTTPGGISLPSANISDGRMVRELAHLPDDVAVDLSRRGGDRRGTRRAATTAGRP